MKIRNATREDIAAMVDLLAGLFVLESDFSPDPDHQRLGLFAMLDGCAKHKCVKVAEAGGEVVAMATAQTLISTAEGGLVGLVEDVVVRPDWQGKGAGRALMAALQDWAALRGLKRLQLLADRDNPGALGFYEKLGWKKTRLACLRKMPGQDGTFDVKARKE